MKEIPAIKSVMTPFPHSIDTRESLTRARQLMSEHSIRHLPVKKGEELVGVVSDREIRDALSAAAEGGRAHDLRVADVTLKQTCIVDMSHPLDAVLDEMSRRRIRSVLVVKGGRLAGIFTETDACRYFAKYLREQFPSGGDDAA